MNVKNYDGGKKTNTVQVLRLTLLAAVLVLMTWLGYRHQLLGGGPSGSPTVASTGATA